MDFPRIDTIDDVLPHIKGRDDIIVADKGDYSVIDYIYANEDTFDHPMRLECRGLKFDSDGKLIARPFHKFFNLGERPEMQEQHFNVHDYQILEKLDGSMVHGAIVEDEFCLMTRMGRTDVAKAAESCLTDVIIDTCKYIIALGFTPIFEWTAPENRIVVKYRESSLTLLAVRENSTGWYHARPALKVFASCMGVSPVGQLMSKITTNSFLKDARNIQDAEGFVARPKNKKPLPWVKIKADAYVRKHKAKDSINREKNVLSIILNNELDDLIPILDEENASVINAYAKAVNEGIDTTANNIGYFIDNLDGLDQKEFALKVKSELPDYAHSLAFRGRKDKLNIRNIVRETVLKNATSQTKVDAFRPLHRAYMGAHLPNYQAV